MPETTQPAAAAQNPLPQVLNHVKRRLLGISLLGGLAWGAADGAALLGLCAWLDLALDLPPGLRVACGFSAAALGILLVAWAAWSAARQSGRDALARRLDRAAGSGGQILSGVDLFHQYPSGSHAGGAPAAHGNLSAAMARMAVERAGRLAAGVKAAAAVPAAALRKPSAALGLVAAGAGLIAAFAPRLAATQWARFTDPYGDHAPYSPVQFKVEPGDTRVLYGSPLDVRVTIEGAVAERLELVLRPEGAKAGAAPDSAEAAEEILPLFPEPGGARRATVADVTSAGRYYVRVHGPHGARSRKFTYDLITVPELRDVRFRVTPPAYTHRPPYEGPLPQDGLAGLPGTRVEVWAKSNRPLSGGSLLFTASPSPAPSTRPAAAPPTPPSLSSLAPSSPGAAEATGAFVITAPGKIELKVTDEAGQSSRDAFAAAVNVSADERPFVRILEPKANSYATPDVTLNISLLAEDDYGVSRLQVFRGLNDSRVRPTDVPVPPNQPTRLPAQVPLDLADYGLNPGDVVKLYARVEDNDPAGPKGYESAVVVVQIISRQDLERMTLAREGMEVLQSKYEQAARRLEALAKRIEELQKQLAEAEKIDPDGEVAKGARQELKELADDAADAASEVAKMAAEDLPFDIDKALKKHLDEVARALEQAAKEAEELAKIPGLSASRAKRGLEAIQQRLGLKREQFQQEAAEPLEHLAKIFPLLEDEARFVDLYQRQRDLAERMKSAEGTRLDHPFDPGGAPSALADASRRPNRAASPRRLLTAAVLYTPPTTGDNPRAKSRQRDLETEQRQIREELASLLADIDNHIAALPDDPKLNDLRESAREFADAVRKSPVNEKMTGAEADLSIFNGAPAAIKAKEAADEMEKLIAKAGGMGGAANGAIKFQPKLAAAVGNTVEQLLAAEGLLPDTGNGSGTGKGGGFSQKRSTLNNVGLYGGLPALARSRQKSGGGKSQPGAIVGGGRNPNEPGDPAGAGAAGRLRAAGESDAAVPARYRKKVGEYFRRVADELGEDK